MGTVTEKSALIYHEIGTGQWYTSLVRQLRERNPPASAARVTAAPDPTALDGLIEQPFPWQSLALHYRQARQPRSERLQPTARPVDPPKPWRNQKPALPRVLAVALHAAVVAFVGLRVPTPGPAPIQQTFVPLYLPVSRTILSESEAVSGGGGGGGNRSEVAPSLGEPPRAAAEQFVPPSAEPPVNHDPVLVMEPTIVAPQLASLLPLTPPDLGDPYNGIPAPPSSGPGIGDGIGTGRGTGVGPGTGTGLGPGEGAGFGQGVFHIGGEVTQPEILFRRDPVYSEEARKARYEGTVVLEAIVRKDGSVEIVRVVRSPGLGLDRQAIEALGEWRFRPAMRDGVPVDVAMSISINFSLH